MADGRGACLASARLQPVKRRTGPVCMLSLRAVCPPSRPQPAHAPSRPTASRRRSAPPAPQGRGKPAFLGGSPAASAWWPLLACWGAANRPARGAGFRGRDRRPRLLAVPEGGEPGSRHRPEHAQSRRPRAGRRRHRPDPHLRRQGTLADIPALAKGLTLQHHAGRMAGPRSRRQRRRTAPADRGHQGEPQRDAVHGRQRDGAARGPDRAAAHGRHQAGAGAVHVPGLHRRALARLAGASRTRRRGGFHHHPPAAVLGRPARRTRRAATCWTKSTEVQAAYPGKQIVIGEVGWPSDGIDIGAAHASA